MVIEGVRLFKNAEVRTAGNGNKFISFSKSKRIGWGESQEDVWQNFTCSYEFYKNVLPYWTEGSFLVVNAEETGGKPAEGEGRRAVYLRVNSVDLVWSSAWGEDGVPKNTAGGLGDDSSDDVEDFGEDDDIPF